MGTFRGLYFRGVMVYVYGSARRNVNYVPMMRVLTLSPLSNIVVGAISVLGLLVCARSL